MRVYMVLLRRELGSYFGSLTGYLIIAITLLLLGFSFVDLLSKLNAQPTDAPVTELFYSTYYFWLILLLTAPVITMRLFAQEKYSGTFETLMTTPVTETQVVLAKFSGAMIFYAVTWMPLMVYVLIVQSYSSEPDGLDVGRLSSTFSGILLIGSLYMALGCFASALTRSQMLAAMLSYGLGVGFFVLSLRALMGGSLTGWSGKVFAYISMTEHMDTFARGFVDTRDVTFYASASVFFLFLTTKVIESRRWK